jgi:hypothetical protein
MAYSPAFFDLQLTFARRIAAKFDLSLAHTLAHYTTFTKSFGAEGWAEYLAGVTHAADATTWTYAWYCAYQQPDPTPDDSEYNGNPLFGCFSFTVRETTIIRPMFVKNDLPGMRPLSAARAAVRQNEIQRMIAYIHQRVPTAQTVAGNSWLYNLAAYRRLYPPAYTATMPINTDDEFQFLALWGQCFDSDWGVKGAVAGELFRRVDTLTDLANLHTCFPYPVLQPRCPITAFYTFYGVDEQ